MVEPPVTVQFSSDHRVAVVSVPIVGDGTNDASYAALAELRDEDRPRCGGPAPRPRGQRHRLHAGSKDFNDLMETRVPIVFAFVLGFAFLLLLVTFRSIVIPIKAILLNLLSVGAAYGVVVWIFQEGHLESLLEFESTGAVVSWLPLFLFVLLFGLSMDYHVFILSRVREAYDEGMPTTEAVSRGIKGTASVVTAAAAVMIAVFAIFATLSSVIFKQFGVGLAVAVLIDATIIRGVLLPATMTLLGDWNWYLPRALDWLPRIGIGERTRRSRRRSRPRPSGRGSPDVPELHQVASCRFLRLLPVDVDAGVELLHHLEGEVLLDALDRLREVRARLLHGLLAGDEEHVSGRQDPLVVVEDHVLVGDEELRVGGEQDREVRLALVEHLVAPADLDRGEALELEPVVPLEPGQAIDPLAALRRSVERQVLRDALEVGDLRDPSPSAVSVRSPTAFALENGRRRERDQAEPLEVVPALLEGLFGIGRDVLGRGSKNEVSAVEVYSG